VVPFGETPLVLVTAVGRYNALAELLAAAKARPGELNYSTSASVANQLGLSAGRPHFILPTTIFRKPVDANHFLR
jgi:hypothetical protein